MSAMPAMPDENPNMTEAEYLAFERQSDTKHEYIDGEVYAMAGATLNHNTIAANVTRHLGNLLDDSNCRVLSSDMRVRAESQANYMYPDVSIVCSEPQLAENVFDSLVKPTVIIEVMSPSTERKDRSKKFQPYRQIESLQTYILVAQDAPRIELYTKNAQGNWVLSDTIGMDATLYIESLACTLSLADIYARVDFSEEDEDDTKESPEDTPSGSQ